MDRKTIGIHIETHASGVSLVEGDHISSCVGEESFTRIKITDVAPVEALRWTLRHRSIDPTEIDEVVFASFPMLKRWLYYARFYLDNLLHTRSRLVGAWLGHGVSTCGKNLIAATGVPMLVDFYCKQRKVMAELPGFKGSISYVGHQEAHMKGGFYTSGYEKALVVLFEGMGWDATACIGLAELAEPFRVLARTPCPHSAGRFYGMITQYLGFDRLLDPGKVTGLAGYGDASKALQVIGRLLRGDENRLYMDPKVLMMREGVSTEVNAALKSLRPEDIAAACQSVFERVILRIVRNWVQRTGVDHIVLVGGCMANVRLNKLIHEFNPGCRIFVHPAMGDQGIALGACLAAVARWKHHQGKTMIARRMGTVHLGPDYADHEVSAAFPKATLRDTESLIQRLATLLVNGKVVALFQGRLEYGPRALGNRSILAYPQDGGVKDRLNACLGRNEFMPFAPVVRDIDGARCFSDLDGIEDCLPFMTIAVSCSEWFKKHCPAVVHVDGTARPQVLTRDANPFLYRLLEEVARRSGVGVLINTSFNLHGEPIVCSPEDASRTFRQASLDAIALNGKFLLEKS